MNNYDQQRDIEAEGQRAIPRNKGSEEINRKLREQSMLPASPDFDQWYVENAFDLELAPLGCRDYALQKKAWMAARERARPPSELLAALKKCRTELWYCAAQLKSLGRNVTVGGSVQSALTASDAAISKAEGRAE